MEGEVVMVRLGSDEGAMDTVQGEEPGSPFMELKPSTTLLVPLELVDEGQGLVDSSYLGLPELQQAVGPDDPKIETPSSFSLMLEMDEDIDKEAPTLSVENNLPYSPQPLLEDDGSKPVANPEVIPLGTDCQEPPQSGEPLPVDQKTDVVVYEVTDLQTESTEANQDAEEVKEQLEAKLEVLAEECEPSVGELSAAVYEEDAADQENKQTPAGYQEEPETNGPVIEAEIVLTAETGSTVEEQEEDQRALEETTEEVTEEPRRITRGRLRKDPQFVEANSPHKPTQGKQPLVPETPTSQRKKAPLTPTRMTTRGRRTVTFVSPLPEEVEEPTEDRKTGDSESEVLVPPSPSRTPRKPKQVAENKASTPRRSSRKAPAEPAKGEVEEGKALGSAAVAASSKASSPARRQRTTSTRSSQKTQSGSEEVSAATEAVEEDHEDQEHTDRNVAPRKGSKSPTPAKRSRTNQENTPRRSRRRILSSTDVELDPSDVLKEQTEEVLVSAPPVSRSSRKTKTQPSDTTLLEESEDQKLPPSSPGRTTRQSNRISLNVYPQVRIQK